MAKKDEYRDQVIGETFEKGSPQAPDLWRTKTVDRKDMLKYIKNSERYWCMDQDEWFGSERRKTKA
jgi:hypothetical protein